MDLIEIEKSDDKIDIIKLSNLSQRIAWAKEGIFLDVLYLDSSDLVRSEVAKTGSYLEELREDLSVDVRLAVLKKTNIEFMNFKSIDNEHPKIIEEILNLGFDIENLDYENNWQIRLALLKSKGLLYCREKNIMDKVKDEHIEIQKEILRAGNTVNKTELKGELLYLFMEIKDQSSREGVFGECDDANILKHAVLNNYKIKDSNTRRVNSLFEDIEFSVKCVKKGLYLSKILDKFREEENILCAFLEKGYYKESITINKKSVNLLDLVKEKMNYRMAKILFDNDIDTYYAISISDSIKNRIDKENNIKNKKGKLIAL